MTDLRDAAAEALGLALAEADAAYAQANYAYRVACFLAVETCIVAAQETDDAENYDAKNYKFG